MPAYHYSTHFFSTSNTPNINTKPYNYPYKKESTVKSVYLDQRYPKNQTADVPTNQYKEGVGRRCTQELTQGTYENAGVLTLIDSTHPVWVDRSRTQRWGERGGVQTDRVEGGDSAPAAHHSTSTLHVPELSELDHQELFGRVCFWNGSVKGYNIPEKLGVLQAPKKT